MNKNRNASIIILAILFNSFMIYATSKHILREKSYSRYDKFSKMAGGKSRIHGYVIDKDGNPVEKALVIATHEDKTTKFKAITNVKGKWFLSGLGTGEFKITVTAKYYYPYRGFLTLDHFRIFRFPIEITIKKPTNEELIAQYKKNGQIPDVAIIGLKEKLIKAETLFKKGNFDEALLLYKYLSDIATKVYQITFRIADCYRKKGEEKKAIEIYKKGIEISIDREDTKSAAKAFGVIGTMFQKNNDLKTATSYFKKSLDTDPKDSLLAYNVAEFYFDYKNMKIDEAIKYYKMAIKIKPSWTLPYKQLGYAYLNKDDRKNAIKTFKKFLEIEPNSKYAKKIKNIMKPKKLRRRRRRR